MPRNPTNTVIVTNVSDEIIETPKPLVDYLCKENNPCEFIVLPKLRRILVICNDSIVAEHVYKRLMESDEWGHLKLSYSMKDNNIFQGVSVEENVDYLELPTEEGSRRFLISPPLSPPPEWDHWDKVEEHPHTQPMTNPNELSHLLWERLGGFDSSTVKKYHQDEERDLNIEPQVLFEDVNNSVRPGRLRHNRQRSMKTLKQ